MAQGFSTTPTNTGTTTTEKKEQYKIIEIAVDPPNTIIRKLVPANTVDGDTPVGSRLLNELETQGRLSRTNDPPVVAVGDMVRSLANLEKVGSVHSKLKTGAFQIHWSDGTKDRMEAKDLQKVY